MNVSFTSEQEAHLTEMARNTGASIEEMVRTAVERMVDEDRRFLEAVQVGIDAADRGEFVDSKDVWARVEATLRSR